MRICKGLIKGIQGPFMELCQGISGPFKGCIEVNRKDMMCGVRVWVLRLSVWGLEVVNLPDDILQNQQIAGPQELW